MAVLLCRFPLSFLAELNLMKVWYVSTQRAWGGGEEYLKNLAAGVAKRGLEVAVMAPKGSPLAAAMREEGHSVFEFAGRGRDPRTIWRFRKRLQLSGPCVVHCNDSHALMLGGLAALGVSQARVLAMRHTMFPIRSPEKYHRLADRTICVSQAVANQCINDGLRDSNLKVIHVGLPIPSPDPAAVAKIRNQVAADNRKLLVAIGNLLPCKGHADLIRAIGLLDQPPGTFVLAIAGEGKHRDELECLRDALPDPESVRLLGFQDNPDDWLAAADAVVHPSHQEGLCLTVVGAMMLRRPVVASPVGGLCEVLAAEQIHSEWSSPLAELCLPEDPASIAKALRTLFDAQESQVLQSQTQVEAAYQHAVQRFGVQPMVEKTLALYESLNERRAAA
ncbi:Glycogen synthase [Roseimaritima multifibrata]|uniref:Glycogen synthase n=2 Tax=Roseimaritima multifibrata TaxID=1930274 RepID=A0A517MCI1_9BACT|nr:Glycogen synthase [Roseimaritima multifibrata]